jgi:hypothetical protein
LLLRFLEHILTDVLARATSRELGTGELVRELGMKKLEIKELGIRERTGDNALKTAWLIGYEYLENMKMDITRLWRSQRNGFAPISSLFLYSLQLRTDSSFSLLI